MKVSLICCYKEISDKIAFAEEVVQKLQTHNNVVDCYVVKDFVGKSFCDIEKKSLASTSVTSEKDMQKLMDELYANMHSIKSDVYVVPISDWKILRVVDKSYLQLTNRNVLFVIDKVEIGEREALLSFADHLYRYRNIHICVIEGKTEEKIYNLHYLQSEQLEDIFKLHLNNRRKYIGWRYKANELRQKIKFHKDLIKHGFLVRFMNPYHEKFDAKISIPKVVHYCWFGGKPMPEKVQRLVESWKEILPDYEFKCWNESNFPFEKYRFAQEALRNKKWAFVADIARLHALYYEGGIYFDTDVEVLKSFDEFLEEDGFTSYESLNLIAMAAIGFKKYHPWIGQMLLWYDCVHCDDDYAEIANTKVVSKITRYLYGAKLDGSEQTLPCGLHIYPRDYFSPELVKDEWKVTERSHCIHHFTGMW